LPKNAQRNNELYFDKWIGKSYGRDSAEGQVYEKDIPLLPMKTSSKGTHTYPHLCRSHLIMNFIGRMDITDTYTPLHFM
jgi:hypothetical protein